jgi:hypothetical protein
MDIAPIDAAHELLKSAIGRPIRPSTGELNVEMLATNPLLPTSRKWAIRFNTSGTVTIVLGMRDYGWGWYSAHFASLAAARLGLPFRWMRVYYSATLPAVLQTPQESRIQPDGCRSGPLAVAVGELIEEMCGRVIENGRAIFSKNGRRHHRQYSVRSDCRTLPGAGWEPEREHSGHSSGRDRENATGRMNRPSYALRMADLTAELQDQSCAVIVHGAAASVRGDERGVATNRGRGETAGPNRR